MSKVLLQMKQWKKHIKQLIIPSWNKVPCYLIWIFYRILFLCCIPIIFLIKRKNKINPQMRCIKTIKNSDLHRSFILSMEKP
jgi:tyrosine-protein phosphatase YwqE